MGEQTLLWSRVVPLLVVCGMVAPSPRSPTLLGAAKPLNLGLSVMSPRTKILACEPLVLHISIRNLGSEPIKMPCPVGFNGPLVLEITSPDEVKKRYYALLRIRRFLRTRVLRPGEVCRQTEVLVYGILDVPGKGKQANFIVPSPGTYRVHLRYEGGASQDARFEAEPLQVTVVEPRGRDLQARALFGAAGSGEFMGRAGGLTEEFKRVANEYGDTVYGRYARYFLVERLRARYLMEMGGGPHLEALLKDAPDFPLADECLLHLSMYLQVRGRRPDAIRALEEIIKKYPHSPVAPRAAKRLEGLRKKAPAPTTQPSSP
jgi:hypothetical protein